jgi:hypothetical protein
MVIGFTVHLPVAWLITAGKPLVAPPELPPPRTPPINPAKDPQIVEHDPRMPVQNVDSEGINPAIELPHAFAIVLPQTFDIRAVVHVCGSPQQHILPKILNKIPLI